MDERYWWRNDEDDIFTALYRSFGQVAWTGMKADKLIAISEQGDRGVQYAMIYVLGVVDGMEGQRAINQEPACRLDDGTTNQEITSKVLETLTQLGHRQEPAGKLVINAYIKS
ncbi:Rap1a/Tai family immunity protein [Photobacterium lutimaris]|uniref:Rap1a immunity protein domain-containing protein n=1 Tax=Photobacterium lutimaris TaxID=388278 RepID=A0A2T3J1M0_9GAMM|nr:Rap1a/Tai family immunity protein [Photobacterium lutimaris]PSU34984.1 hypothetical protein C9I99_07910 [Photobacterium lutimaris]TDR77339.1 hypothetical protein DFP78_102356 [Photobacterium lutimaris]